MTKVAKTAIFLAATLLAFAQAAGAGQTCDAANAKIASASAQIQARLGSEDDLFLQTCGHLESGILIEWASRECASDPELPAADRQGVDAQAKEMRRYNRQIEQTARQISDGGKYCPLHNVAWTGLIGNYQ